MTHKFTIKTEYNEKSDCVITTIESKTHSFFYSGTETKVFLYTQKPKTTCVAIISIGSFYADTIDHDVDVNACYACIN